MCIWPQVPLWFFLSVKSFNMNSLPSNSYTYIGMSDLSRSGDHRWTDGTVLMWSRWYATQPDQFRGIELYGSFINTGYFNDVDNSRNYPGLCEKTGK